MCMRGIPPCAHLIQFRFVKRYFGTEDILAPQSIQGQSQVFRMSMKPEITYLLEFNRLLILLR